MFNAWIIIYLSYAKLFIYSAQPQGTTSIAQQLNYITNIVLELKVESAKIKIEVKEIKKKIFVICLSLVNEIRHIEKPTLSIGISF